MSIPALWSLVPFAAAAPKQVQFCALVDVSYVDEVGGSRWNAASVDQPAAGFYFEIDEQGQPAGSPPILTGFLLGHDHQYAGCYSGTLVLDNSKGYTFTIRSTAWVDDRVVYAVTSPAVFITASQIFSLNAGFSGGLQTLIVDGDSVAHFNHLAMVGYALHLNDLGLTAAQLPEVVIFEDAPPASVFATEKVGGGNFPGLHLSPAPGVKRKFVVIHELGHYLSFVKDFGGDDCIAAPAPGTPGQYAAPLSATPCVGHPGAPNTWDLLTEEYAAAAGCEGIANFYGALVWNDPATGLCTYVDNTSIDWDIDQDVEVSNTSWHLCFTDPYLGDVGATATDTDCHWAGPACRRHASRRPRAAAHTAVRSVGTRSKTAGPETGGGRVSIRGSPGSAPEDPARRGRRSGARATRRTLAGRALRPRLPPAARGLTGTGPGTVDPARFSADPRAQASHFGQRGLAGSPPAFRA